MNSMIFSPTIECLDYRFEQGSQKYGRFRIAPLDRGQAITVANTLRRTLISNLGGIAITSIRFQKNPEAFHEYSTIPGMQDSVFELLLNFKDIILASTVPLEEFETQVCVLKVDKMGILRADSIPFPESIEVMNSDQYLTTITSLDCPFEIEITIERGQGSIVQTKLNGSSLEDQPALPIEAMFSPVKRVNYTVEEYILQQGHNFGKLEKEMILLECWTNGSITPREALDKSVEHLIHLFRSLLEADVEIENQTEIESPMVLVNKEKSYENNLIEELGLSVRSYNCLKSAQIHTVGDLLDYSIENLLEIKNFGSKSAEEVVKVLQNQFGLELPSPK